MTIVNHPKSEMQIAAVMHSAHSTAPGRWRRTQGKKVIVHIALHRIPHKPRVETKKINKNTEELISSYPWPRPFKQTLVTYEAQAHTQLMRKRKQN